MKAFIFVFLVLVSGTSLAGSVLPIDDFTLTRYQGKVVYLDFWASWCKPCQKSFPWMNSLKQRFPSDQFEVVAINLDRKIEDMQTFLHDVPANFTIYHDPKGTLAEKFQLPGMPTSFIIDKQGKAVKKHIGFFSDKTHEIESEIESLL